ncbi:hypothetical protein NQZ68_026803 [Dissostichus eleginoides]|nr:hypothetical protein NQZ68_026803 [Dissostichus eleginoides]
MVLEHKKTNTLDAVTLQPPRNLTHLKRAGDSSLVPGGRHPEVCPREVNISTAVAETRPCTEDQEPPFTSLYIPVIRPSSAALCSLQSG